MIVCEVGVEVEWKELKVGVLRVRVLEMPQVHPGGVCHLADWYLPTASAGWKSPTCAMHLCRITSYSIVPRHSSLLLTSSNAPLLAAHLEPARQRPILRHPIASSFLLAVVEKHCALRDAVSSIIARGQKHLLLAPLRRFCRPLLKISRHAKRRGGE
jgi:hypothetical protein